MTDQEMYDSWDEMIEQDLAAAEREAALRELSCETQRLAGRVLDLSNGYSDEMNEWPY